MFPVSMFVIVCVIVVCEQEVYTVPLRALSSVGWSGCTCTQVSSSTWREWSRRCCRTFTHDWPSAPTSSQQTSGTPASGLSLHKPARTSGFILKLFRGPHVFFFFLDNFYSYLYKDFLWLLHFLNLVNMDLAVWWRNAELCKYFLAVWITHVSFQIFFYFIIFFPPRQAQCAPQH